MEEWLKGLMPGVDLAIARYDNYDSKKYNEGMRRKREAEDLRRQKLGNDQLARVLKGKGGMETYAIIGGAVLIVIIVMWVLLKSKK